ncbi:membrane protein [Skermanella stibiiresistens SB22]|uniref:Membrane protein n=2 Tax=Skermanella TaxID=204447 RepID=W9HDE5_9PROT|nr:membrane protein [Skermanella stibiiresistens SB22]
MRRGAAWAGTGAGLLALVCYSVAIHGAVVSGGGTATAGALALVQAVVAGLTISRLAPRQRWIGFIVAPALALLSWYSARDGLIAASGIGHAAIHGGLLALFAGTLAEGREPLITTIARKVRGDLTDDMEAYTRRVTWAWCLFFAGQILMSTALFLFAPTPVWSFFVNVLDLPLVVAMFMAEYSYRLWRFANHAHGSIADVVRVFAEQPER